MQGRPRYFVRTFLPAIALCLCHACGVIGDGKSDKADETAPLTLAAIASNAPPIIAVAAIANAQVGTPFDYQPTVQDPDHDTLRFTAVNLPIWASLDSSSGRISGTPGPTEEGVYESISITVADATHQ